MKRYMLLGGDNLYPSGGMNDFIDYFDDIDDANDRGRSEEWYQVIDTTNMQIITAYSTKKSQWDFYE